MVAAAKSTVKVSRTRIRLNILPERSIPSPALGVSAQPLGKDSLIENSHGFTGYTWIESRSFILQVSSRARSLSLSLSAVPTAQVEGSLSLSKDHGNPCLPCPRADACLRAQAQAGTCPRSASRRAGRRANGTGRGDEIQKNQLVRISVVTQFEMRFFGEERS